MADPEIQLPAAPERYLAGDDSTEISLSSPLSPYSLESEKESMKSKDELGSSTDIRSQPVQHRYLTFETELPRPAGLLRSSLLPTASSTEPPEAPDLSSYACPFDWSPMRKNAIIWTSCTATALTAFTAGSYSPGLKQMTVSG